MRAMADTDNTASQPRRSKRELGMFLAFKPGQSVMVQIPTDPQRYWGRIIGTDPYDCFILKLPMVPGILRMATAGAVLTLRMESEGELYGFSCEVISAIFKPSPLLVLSYPTSTERLQLRSHKRVRCLIPGVLANDYFNSQAFMVDVSRGGCRLLLDMFQKQRIVNLMSGDKADLNVSLDSLTPLRLSTEVVNIQDQGQGRFVSARFNDEDADTQSALAEFMTRLEAIETLLDGNSKN